MDLKPSTKNYSKIRFLKKLYRRIAQLAVIILVAFLGKVFIYDKSSIESFINEQIQLVSEKTGFIVNTIEISSSNKYCDVVTAKTFENYKNTSIFLVSLADLQEQLHVFDCIKDVSVTRMMPDSIRINLKNKEPIGIWQHNKKFSFITDDLKTMKIRDTDDLDKFIIFTGANANVRAKDLLAIISVDKSVFSNIDVAMRIGDRRWDIRLKNGVEIRLPSKNPELAWNKFIELTQNSEFQKKKFKTVDLRIENKIYAK